MLGSYRVGNWKFAYRAGYCTVCEAETVAEGRRSIVVMHVYFVPLFPVGLHTAWMCPHCACDINSRRPTHPGTFYVGLACAAIMAAIGVAIAVVTGNQEAGSILVLVSAVMSAVLVYFMRINRYAEYRENVRRVEPLIGDVCPVCGDRLQEGSPPRCLFCDVNILTH